ncbi:hypothetical protein ACFL3J_00065 [Candidatus Omnitrophota bacterium]
MKKLYICLGILSVIILTGCAPSMSSCLERGRLESQVLEGSYNDTFEATLPVLQNYGFIVKSSDSKTGLIKADSATKRGWFGVTTTYGITATVVSLSENQTKVELQLAKFVRSEIQYGIKEGVRVIDNPQLLRSIYIDIQKEIYMRETSN